MEGYEAKTNTMTAEEKSELFLMGEFYKLIKDMEKVDKTIIIYDVYEEDKKMFLSNLHSIAAGILSEQVEVQGVYDEDPDDSLKYIIYNSCDIKAAQENNLIQVTYFKVEENSKETQLGNIRLYHSTINDKKVRVVTLPIEQTLINKSQIEDINAKFKKFEDDNLKKQRQLQGTALNEFLESAKKQKENMKDQYCRDMKEKHQKMFNIEALLHAIRANTKLISVCGMINSNQCDPAKNIKQINGLMDNLFEVTKEGRQLILHSVTNNKRIPEFEGLEGVSSVWKFVKEGKCIWTKNNCFNEKYFTTETKNIKSRIYKLLSQGKNQYLAKVIEDFVKTWTNIAFSSSTCITPVVKKVYQALEFGEDLSKSFVDVSQSIKKQALDLSKASSSNKSNPDSKQTFTVYTFKEVFQKFGVRQMKSLRENQSLKQFYTTERLEGIKVQKGEDTIPKEIQLLTFIHYFYKINKQFCNKFVSEEKKDQAQLQNFVKSYLKTIYELVNAINQNEALTQGFKCPDMQTYYNFLDFIFHSSSLIRSITNRQLPICNSLKAFFDNLIPRDNKLLTFILNNEENIKEGQPVHYYDIYLRIIRENSKGFESNIEYIYLMIHRFKADQISARFIYEKQRVVEAIKSYSEIIHQYNRIVEAKRDKINKLDIEKRIARLLLVIGLPDQAAAIYQKNHLVKSAEKCFKQILQEHHGDDKANKYIEFGKYLESELSFAKAIDYYQSAYEAAKSTGVRQECIKRKMECVLHSSNLREAEKRLFERYYQGTGTESEFLNSLVIEQGNASQSQFSRLRNRLQWDQKKQQSVIMEDNEDYKEEQMIL